MTGGPIFILGMQRGGTNQLLNILRSHPDTIWPDGEFHEVLRPKWDAIAFPAKFSRQLYRYLPVLLRKGDVLSPHKPPGSGALDQRIRTWMAKRLEQATSQNAAEVARFRAAMQMQGFSSNGSAAHSRMVVKLVNFNVGFARDLHLIYPDASFIGITREAIGVCESMISRGMPPEKALPLYQFVTRQLLEMRDSGFPILLVRFEEIIADIVDFSARVYAHCGLDADAVTGFCLQDKTRLFDKDGQVVGVQKVDAFFDLTSAGDHLRGDVNATARARMPEDLRRQIDESCGPIMQQLGYVSDPIRTL